MIKVSVIIPTYNNVGEIERAVNSILEQSYKNLEIIIVDDASLDGTYELVKRIYSGLDNIKIMKNEVNMKSAFTRNRAIEVSQGEYIVIQDADDYSNSDRVKKQIEFLELNKEIDFVGSNAVSFDDDGIWKKSNVSKNPLKVDFEYGNPFIHASITFRKNILDNVNGYRVAKETARGQDYDLLMRLYANGYRGSNLEDYLYCYYETHETIKKRNLKNRFNAVKIKLRYYPWRNMSLSGKIKLIRTLLIGLIPANFWYKFIKYKSNKSLKENEDEK